MKHVIYCLIGIVVFAVMISLLFGLVLLLIKVRESGVITKDSVGWTIVIIAGSFGIYHIGRVIGEDLLKIK